MKNNRNQLGQFTKGWIPAQKIIFTDNQINLVKKIYLDEQKSITEIIKELNISRKPITTLLKQLNILRDTNEARKIYIEKHEPWNKGKKLELIQIDKKQLYQLYVIEKKSIADIAKLIKISCSTIRNRLVRYGWIRSMSEALKGHKIDEQTKYKISNSLKGHTPGNKGMKFAYKPRPYLKGRIPWNKGKKGLQQPWNKGKSFLTLEKNPNWKGGKSFELYGLAFNNHLKEKIRGRDNYRCQECFRHQDELYDEAGKKYKLNVHHIDYDKNNNIENNLISLCKSCHSQTNFKREDWTKYYKEKLCH